MICSPPESPATARSRAFGFQPPLPPFHPLTATNNSPVAIIPKIAPHAVIPITLNQYAVSDRGMTRMSPSCQRTDRGVSIKPNKNETITLPILPKRSIRMGRFLRLNSTIPPSKHLSPLVPSYASDVVAYFTVSLLPTPIPQKSDRSGKKPVPKKEDLFTVLPSERSSVIYRSWALCSQSTWFPNCF